MYRDTRLRVLPVIGTGGPVKRSNIDPRSLFGVPFVRARRPGRSSRTTTRAWTPAARQTTAAAAAGTRAPTPTPAPPAAASEAAPRAPCACAPRAAAPASTSPPPSAPPTPPLPPTTGARR
eukprot:1192458-Prorocentrum_minimum.AAC.1